MNSEMHRRTAQLLKFGLLDDSASQIIIDNDSYLLLQPSTSLSSSSLVEKYTEFSNSSSSNSSSISSLKMLLTNYYANLEDYQHMQDDFVKMQVPWRKHQNMHDDIVETFRTDCMLKEIDFQRQQNLINHMLAAKADETILIDAINKLIKDRSDMEHWLKNRKIYKNKRDLNKIIDAHLQPDQLIIDYMTAAAFDENMLSNTMIQFQNDQLNFNEWKQSQQINIDLLSKKMMHESQELFKIVDSKCEKRHELTQNIEWLLHVSKKLIHSNIVLPLADLQLHNYHHDDIINIKDISQKLIEEFIIKMMEQVYSDLDIVSTRINQDAENYCYIKDIGIYISMQRCVDLLNDAKPLHSIL